jgi:hypothetical protein
LLDALRQSKKYVTPCKQEEDRLRSEGKKDKAIEMAKVLKQQNVEISIIAKASGLREDEIIKL